jgi:DNA recombination protein RmuC
MPGGEEMNLYVMVILLGLILGLMAFLLWRMRGFRGMGGEEIQRVVQTVLLEERVHSTELLQRHGSDLAERIARATGELRQSTTDRLTEEFRGIEQRLEARLALGRRELHEGLLRTTEALERKFFGLQEATQRDLDGIRAQLDQRLLAIGKEVQTKLDQNIREGFQHFEKVQEHLRAAERQLQSVGQVGASINELNSLLKLPHLRGGFGESSLERLLADFLPSHLFELQATITGVGRVDAIVRFPKACLPIDSKFPREQLLPLFESSQPEELVEARKALVQVMKVEGNRIARYIRPELGTMDMALMFLPSETLYLEVIRSVTLWEELGRRKVYPVSPTTLAVTLRSISIAHDYYEMARNVEHTIVEVRKAQRHFELFEQRFEEVGRGLDKAQDAFRTASTHLGRYSGAVVRLTDEGGSGEEDALESQRPVTLGPSQPSNGEMIGS